MFLFVSKFFRKHFAIIVRKMIQSFRLMAAAAKLAELRVIETASSRWDLNCRHRLKWIVSDQRRPVSVERRGGARREEWDLENVPTGSSGQIFITVSRLLVVSLFLVQFVLVGWKHNLLAHSDCPLCVVGSVLPAVSCRLYLARFQIPSFQYKILTRWNQKTEWNNRRKLPAGMKTGLLYALPRRSWDSKWTEISSTLIPATPGTQNGLK